MPTYPYLTPTLELQRRFWSKVNMQPDGCWLWTDALTGTGTCYGMIKINGLVYRANRVAWMLTYGPIPDGFGVLHDCDNPPCVRPDHLFVGDQQRNHDDKKEKGRTSHLFGEDSGRHKLVAEQVLWARSVYIPFHPEYGARALARRLNVSHTAMKHALHGINWSHL